MCDYYYYAVLLQQFQNHTQLNTITESTESLTSLQLPRLEIANRSSRPSQSGRDGLNSPGLALQSPNTLVAMLSPTTAKKTVR